MVPNAAAMKQRNSKRAALLIYRQPKESYHILKSLTSPKLPIEGTYEEMIKLMGDYLEPKLTIPFLPIDSFIYLFISEGRGECSDVCRQVEGATSVILRHRT